LSRPTRETAAGRAYLDLQNHARRERRGTQEVLTLYVIERWFARLSRSAYAGDFVLKGGMLLAAFGQRRPTADADALARNMGHDEAAVAARVAEVGGLPDPDDGVEFLTDTVASRTIREEAHYSGVRVTMDARIATAMVKLRLDINFGDPITPPPQVVELPALRTGVAPVRVLGYPIETVLAEKIATAIELGPANTRVRDYADVQTLTGSSDVGYASARDALMTTALFRGVELRPLSDVVGNLVLLRSRAYTAYRSSLGQYGEHLPEEFAEVVAATISFADPLITDQPKRWVARERRWTADDMATNASIMYVVTEAPGARRVRGGRGAPARLVQGPAAPSSGPRSTDRGP